MNTHARAACARNKKNTVELSSAAPAANANTVDSGVLRHAMRPIAHETITGSAAPATAWSSFNAPSDFVFLQ
jgi:hypothetical protein